MNDERTRRWLAFLRIYVGSLWLAYGSSKFEPSWAAPNGEFYQAAKFGADSIHGPMHDFIMNVVLPHQQIFGLLIAVGETLVGISLVLGLFTRAGAIGGMFLSDRSAFVRVLHALGRWADRRVCKPRCASLQRFGRQRTRCAFAGDRKRQP